MSIGGLFSAAKSIITKIVHPTSTATKPITTSSPIKIATGPTPMFPSVNPQGGAGQPYSQPGAPQNPNYGGYQPAYNPANAAPSATVRQPAPGVTPVTITLPNGQTATYNSAAAAAEARQRYDAAAAALSQHQNLIQKALKNGAYVAGTPGRYIGSFVAKRQEAKWLEQYNKQANAGMNQAVSSWQKKIGDAGKALARGDISVDQYNNVVAQARSSVTKLANSYNDTISSTSKDISSPTTGRAASILNGFLGAANKLQLDKVWRYTLGSGDKNIPSIVSAPTRILNILHNSGWRPGVNQFGAPLTPGKPINKINKEGGGSFIRKPGALNAWQATFNQRPFNLAPTKSNKLIPRAFNTAQDLALDPANWVTAGLWAKVGSKVAGGAKWAARLGAPAADAFAGTKAGSKLIDTAKWLNAPYSGPQGAFINKLVRQTGKEYKGLNDAEIQAYQTAMKSGGTLSFKDTSRFARQGADINKVLAFTDKKTAEFNKLFQAEKAAGIKYTKRFGYFPVQEQVQRAVKSGEFPTEWSPFFARSRLARANRVGFSRQELVAGNALRNWAHLRATGQLPSNRLRRTISIPNKIWKASVLPLRPAWYAYNFAWNVPASLMAGGRRTAAAYGKIARDAVKERTFRPNIMRNVPDGIAGGLFGESPSLLRRPGGWLEDLSRVAAYHGAVGKTKDPIQAEKLVNRYLFNYHNLRNWERPIKTVFPFWNFQKNINRLALQLPFTNPKAARALYYARRQLVDQPLSQLPNQSYNYTDPQTGEKVSYNPRDAYKGKVKIGNRWTTTPWLPIFPEQLSQFGTSPWLSLAGSYTKNKDFFGNSTNDKSFWSNLGGLFPQYKVGSLGMAALNKNPNQAGIKQGWITSSGYTKERQGYDPTKPNYTTSLDPSVAFKKVVKNFLGLGVLNANTFDEKKFRENMNYLNFSKDYFAHDWNKEYPDYNQRAAAETALAKKYGYDLQKDLFDGKWSKYDTPQTAAVKLEKQTANELQNQVYQVYNSLPKGTGDRSKFIQQWKNIMANTDFLDKYPNFSVFKNIPIAAGTGKVTDTKFANTTDTKTNNSSTSYRSGGSSAASFWQKYYAAPSAAYRRAMLRNNPQYAKFPVASSDPTKAKIAWAYKNLNPDERRAWLKKEGIYTDHTPAEWADILAKSNTNKQTRLSMDLFNHPELGDLQLAKVNEVVSTFAPRRKANQKAIAFLPTPGRNRKSKRLTWNVA